MKNVTAQTNTIFSIERSTRLSPLYLGLLIIITFLPLFEGGLDHKATNWALFLALAVTLWAIIREKATLNLESRLPFLLYGLLLFWSGISIFWSIAPHRTMIELLQLALYGTVMFLATRLTRDEYYRIIRIVLLVGVLLALHGILQNVLLGAATVNSTFHHHNPFGIYMVILFFCAWGYYQKYRNKITLLASVILLMGLFISGSRGALVALVLASPLLFIGLPLDRRKVLSLAAKTLGCVLIAFLLATVIMQTLSINVNTLEEPLAGILGRPDYLEAHNVFARFSYWEVGFEMMRKKPLQGYGLGTFFAASALVDSWREHFARFAHNHYLQTFAETGVIGFLLLASFLVSALVTIKKNYKPAKIQLGYPGVVSAILAYIIHISVDFSWNVPAVSVLFFTLVGMLLSPHQTSVENEVGLGDVFEKKRNSVEHKFLLTVALFLLLLNSWYYTAVLFYNQSLKAEQDGDHSRAVAYYEIVNRFYPINARAYYSSCNNRLVMYQQTGDEKYLQDALVDVERAVKVNPLDPLLRNTLGLIYNAAGNDPAAREQFYLGHKYSSNYLPRYVKAAAHFLQRGDLVATEKTALKGLTYADYVLGVVPTAEEQNHMIRAVVDLHLLLVEVYEKLEDNIKAGEHLHLAREIMPGHPGLFYYTEE